MLAEISKSNMLKKVSEDSDEADVWSFSSKKVSELNEDENSDAVETFLDVNCRNS